jgi:outer membrane protein assembly factor BamB
MADPVVPPVQTELKPTVAWRVGAPGGQGVQISTVPAATVSSFYALTPRGALVSLNQASGATQWSAPRGSGSDAPARLLVADDRILWASDTVNGIDIANGARIWTYVPAFTTAGCDPSVSGDLFIVCTRDWNVVALRAKTGEVVWTRPLRDSLRGVPTLKATVTSGDTVYAVVKQDYSQTVGFSVAIVFAIDRRTGVILSSFQEGNYTDFLGDVTTPTVVGNNLILSHITINRLTAIDRFTRRAVWRVNGEAGWAGFQLFGPLAVRDGTIFASSADRRVYAIDALAGTVRWKSEALEGSQFAAAVCGAYVFTWTGVNVRVLNKSTGAFIGGIETGPSPAFDFSTRPVVEGSGVFLQSAAEFRKLNCTS